MAGVQIVVDPLGGDFEMLRATVESLVADGYVVHALVDANELCPASFEALHAPEASAADDGPPDAILIVSGPVLFAAGSVRWLLQAAAVPGRVVTRVLIPGSHSCHVALWSARWVNERRLKLIDIARANADFDRKWLSQSSPQERVWVLGGELGIVATCDMSINSRRWARSQGRRLRLRRAYGLVRKRVGMVKRRASLWRQRRRMRLSDHKR